MYANIRGVNLYNILDGCHASDAPHQPAGVALRASHAAVLARRLGHTPRCLASRLAAMHDVCTLFCSQPRPWLCKQLCLILVSLLPHAPICAVTVIPTLRKARQARALEMLSC